VPPWQRYKSVAVLGVVGAAALTWALAFAMGWGDSDWNTEWSSPTETRGKSVHIGSRPVETNQEKEQRLAPANKDLRDDLGNLKKEVLGDGHKTRGDEVIGQRRPPPSGFDYNPREACMQMQMQFPERYRNVNCMDDKYDSPDPWWQSGR